MARKLSRIARGGHLIVAAGFAATFAVSASAEPNVKISQADNVIENPFAARSTQPRPAVVPASTQRERRDYRNPFSKGASTAAPPMRLRVPRTGAAGEWRRPVPASAASITAQPGNAVEQSARPAANDWDVLSPSNLGTAEPAQFGPPNTAQSTRAAAPPDPTKFSSHDPQQPPWLLPTQRDSDPGSGQFGMPTTTIPLASPTHVDRSAGQPLRSPPVARSSSHAEQPVDPFDRSGAMMEVVEVSDQETTSPAMSINLATAGAATSLAGEAAAQGDGPNPGALYVAAQQAAESANSWEELSDVVRLCQQGLDRRPRSELAQSLRSLAAWACNRRGEIMSDAGQARAALAEFDTAIRLDPGCWLALHNRAISHAQQGHAVAALRDFNRVAELNPGLAAAFRNRGELLGFVGRTEEAVADYSRALAQFQDDAELYDMRGHALHRLGRYQEAINDFDRSIELEPNDAEALTHRGNVYAELGEFQRAVDDLERALAVDAKCAGAYRSLAWLKATCPDPQLRDSRQAVAAAEQAAQLSPHGDPFVLDALAAAYASAGQFEPAVRYQTEAIAVAPESFAPQFASRLTIYQQGRPFRNGASRDVGDDVRAASHNAAEQHQPVNRAH